MPRSRSKSRSTKTKRKSRSNSIAARKPRVASKKVSRSRSNSSAKNKSKSQSRSSGGSSTENINNKKREYRLVEQNGDEAVITTHHAFSKGPADAAAKLSKHFFKDKNEGSKVRLTITKVSDGRNQGAIYEFEVTQYYLPLKKGEKAPPGIVREKNGKLYRIKRKADKLNTITKTMMKKGVRLAAKNPRESKDLYEEEHDSYSSKEFKLPPKKNKDHEKGRVSKSQRLSASMAENRRP